MSEAFTKPFTKDEIAAMRHAFRSDEGVNGEVCGAASGRR